MKIQGINGAEAILRVLRSMGVERIFASPGSEWAPLWEALAKPYGADEVPQYMSTRHEETAVAMATGYAKATGKLPAVIIHTTVGALHATMALRAALHERVPMVVLTGESIGFGDMNAPDPGQQWLRVLADNGGPAKLVRDVVKWSYALTNSAILPATIQRACQLAMTAPRGPTFVSISMEHMFETMILEPRPADGTPAQPVASAQAIDRAAQMLASAASPLIITDEVGRTSGAVKQLVALAELLAAPVVESSHLGYVNFPRDHPLHAGLGGGDLAKGYLNNSDCALLVDAVAPWHPPSSAPGPNTRTIVLSDDPLHEHVPHWGFRSDLVVQGATEASLAALLDRVKQLVGSGSRAAQIEQWRAQHEKRRATTRQEGRAAGEKDVIDTAWVAHELNQILPDNAIVVDETITHRVAILRQLDRLTPGRYFEAAYGGLGMGIGYALGIKAALPDRPIINVIGDGSFNYNPVLGSFGVAQEHKLAVMVVLFNNAGYLSQKTGVPQYYPDGFAVKTQRFGDTSIEPMPEYAMLAQAYDGYGETVTKPADVRAALLRGLEAINSGKLALIDMRLLPVSKTARRS